MTDTVVVRPNTKKKVQEVLVEARSPPPRTAPLRVTWSGTRALTAGRAATVQVTGTGRYGSHRPRPTATAG